MEEDHHNTLLLQLVTNGNVQSLASFLQQHNSSQDDINLHQLHSFRDKHGSTLLHYAAGYGHVAMCRYLLESSATNNNTNDKTNLNLLLSKSNNNERTPLHWAARNGHTYTCQLFIQDYQMPVDTLAKGQVTPLQLSMWQCHLDTCKALVEWGANVKYVNKWGCGVGHWLGKYTFNNNDHDEDEHELVRQACQWLFQDQKVAHNSPNHCGQTPLHKAAFSGNFIVAHYLVRTCGVIDNQRDSHGNTCADCAERNGQWELAKWLRRYASKEVFDALKILGLLHHMSGLLLRQHNNENVEKDTMAFSSPMMHTMPAREEIRGSYLKLARVHHPDKKHIGGNTSRDACHDGGSSHSKDTSASGNDGGTTSRSTSFHKWNSIRDAHNLLQSWWNDDPDVFDFQIRIRSRNSILLEHERLCWLPTWHDDDDEVQQSTEGTATATATATATTTATAATTNSMDPKQKNHQTNPQNTTKTTTSNTIISEFESRLVRLLSSDSYRQSGLNLAQLPKEFEKNFHLKLPKPQEFGHRKLIQLLQCHCSSVKVEFREGRTNLAVLRVA